MRLANSDLPLMRRNMLAAGASVLLSSAMLFGVSQYADQSQRDQRSAQILINDAQGHLAAARQDQQNMSAYSDEYGALEERKIIGDEQRLDWIEGLDKLRSQNLVSDFRYHLAPQKSYTAIPATERGSFDIRYSEMTLQFDLMHEAQLLVFFDALHREIDGRYQLEGCTLQRIAAPTPEAPQLKAECSGGWITLKSRNLPR